MKPEELEKLARETQENVVMELSLGGYRAVFQAILTALQQAVDAERKDCQYISVPECNATAFDDYLHRTWYDNGVQAMRDAIRAGKQIEEVPNE